MTTENNRDDNQSADDNAVKITPSQNKDDRNTSGDPGRTPGAAEGDEETIDEDIREKEAEGKL